MVCEASPTSVNLAPYNGCPCCSNLLERFPNALRSHATPSISPDGFDWNKYYWGSDWPPKQPAERKAFRCPLSHNITRRFPLELYQRIVYFLRGERTSLCSCALVCRAWHHHVHRLLHLNINVWSRKEFDALLRRQFSFQNGPRRLRISPTDKGTTHSTEYHKAFPMVVPDVLAHQLQCLFFEDLQASYNRNIAMFMSQFSRLVHLTLKSFILYSFEDLRRIVCALPNLLELELIGGNTISRHHAVVHEIPISMPRRYPHLRKLRTVCTEASIMVPLSQWIASTDICSTCTELDVSPHRPEVCVLWLEPLLRKLGPTLMTLRCNARGELQSIGT